MDKIPDFSDALYNSSDDSKGGPSTSKSGVVSEMPRRRYCLSVIHLDQ